ncbi:MAG: hypothetical protein IPP72_01015 [Chitinophagaceae bacterium]|nr:hypothetical protein [Chitinophagaceae bacterium]
MKDTKSANREKLHRSLMNNTISKNLSMPLSDSTEENWMDAFYAMELIRYKSPWTESRIHEAFNGIEKRTLYFQRSLMELLYDSYPGIFEQEAKQLLDSTEDPKLLSMCAEYLLRMGEKHRRDIAMKTWQLMQPDSSNAILKMLFYRLNIFPGKKKLPVITDLLHHRFFEKDKVVFSFQRKNRDYPGLAIIRDSAGNFVTDAYGRFFAVPQLARSMSNLPGYLSNGNTPQGIFRMYGISVSKSNFIGPTPNIQLTMPVETSIKHFMNDSSIADSVWTAGWYQKLLPESWKDYFPFYETYYAGKAGRNEIIAHGSTVDPAYYKGQPYYPLTPMLGCLCTREIWNGEDGMRTESDQHNLVDALKKAGGANGYYIVIELNDEQRAVDMNDILSLLK